jgi:hypothetical protein
MSDAVITEAIKLRDRILACGREFEIRKRTARSPVDAELAEVDFQACQEAAAMLQKLGTEVTRLRLAIQHFDYGRISRFDLREITTNWNGDK